MRSTRRDTITQDILQNYNNGEGGCIPVFFCVKIESENKCEIICKHVDLYSCFHYNYLCNQEEHKNEKTKGQNKMTNTVENKSILSVLRTKAGAIENNELSSAKKNHMDAVIELGFEVVDSNDSAQGYVSVRNAETGRSIVISKGYDNRSNVYLNGMPQSTEKTFNEFIKDFDFFGYLNKEMKPVDDTQHVDAWDKVHEYKRTKRYLGYGIRRVEQLEEEIALKMQELEEAKKSVAEYEATLEAYTIKKKT